MSNYIWVTNSFEGFHKYLNAPKEVSFLRNEHRHIFHTKIYIEIFHNDRDLEFILFKRYINSLFKNNNFDYKSCEMISDDLYKQISLKYPKRKIKIEVSEDLENGCLKEYE